MDRSMYFVFMILLFAIVGVSFFIPPLGPFLAIIWVTMFIMTLFFF